MIDGVSLILPGCNKIGRNRLISSSMHATNMDSIWIVII